VPECRANATSGVFLLAVLLVGCDQARVAGGTTGTDAGNAVTARLSLPDGCPAAGAQVVIRPSGAVDSSSAARWVHAQADEGGIVRVTVPSGTWTLEARRGGLALRADLPGSADTTLSGTLDTVRGLKAAVLGGKPGDVVALPGLALWTRLNASLAFAFDSVPPGSTPLSLRGEADWALPAGVDSLLVAAAFPASVYQGGRILSGSPVSVVSPWLVPDSLLSDTATAFTDSMGAEIPDLVGRRRGAYREIWLRLPPSGRIFLRRKLGNTSATARPFPASDGFRLAWITDAGDTSLQGSFLRSSTAAFDSTTDSGAFLRAALGGSVGTVDAGLPDTGAFSISMDARLLSPAIGSIWILDWTDSTTGQGLRVGVGAGALVLQAGGLDTSVEWDPGQAWFRMGLSWDGQALRVAFDGVEKVVLQPAGSGLSGRSAWGRREVGLGGGIDLADFLVFDRAVSGADLSRDPAPLR
jgi:hypothetical protein